MVFRLLNAIVRNDAMKSDPSEIYNWRVFALVGASCFGGMLFGKEPLGYDCVSY